MNKPNDCIYGDSCNYTHRSSDSHFEFTGLYDMMFTEMFVEQAKHDLSLMEKGIDTYKKKCLLFKDTSYNTMYDLKKKLIQDFTSCENANEKALLTRKLVSSYFFLFNRFLGLYIGIDYMVYIYGIFFKLSYFFLLKSSSEMESVVCRDKIKC